MRPEETIDFHIRWAWHGIARMYNLEASKHDTTMSVGQTLLNIDLEGTPSTKLGPKMGMESRSLTRILKSMEEKGLISKKPDVKDKRMVRIYLTDKGRAKREVSKEAVIMFNTAIHEKIGKTNLQTFFKVMKKINEVLNTQALKKNGAAKNKAKNSR